MTDRRRVAESSQPNNQRGIMKTTKNYEATAKNLAREANVDYFESRGGTISMDGGEVALFDNHPMVNEPMEARIPLMTAAAEAAGGTVLAVASYPESGPSAGYTVVVIISGADFSQLCDGYRDDVRGRPLPAGKAS